MNETNVARIDQMIESLQLLKADAEKWDAAGVVFTVRQPDFDIHNNSNRRTLDEAVALAKSVGGKWRREESSSTGWLTSERENTTLTIFYTVSQETPKSFEF